MRGGYVEMTGGASGNMLFGAFVDAGMDLDDATRLLRTIAVTGWTIRSERRLKRGVNALYLDVDVPGEDHDAHAHHRSGPPRYSLEDAVRLLTDSGLSPRARERACAIATRLTEAEGGVFHPIGQVDAIVDIAATCIALDLLAIDRLFCSAVPIGRRLPAATAHLLEGFPRRAEAIEAETVTTTGAAILASLIAEPGLRPNVRVERSGTGCGRSDFPIPNVLRVEIGEVIAPG